MKRQLPHPLALGDVVDVEACVRRAVATLKISAAEREELVADGLELVSRRYAELSPGASLRAALAGWLKLRLRDRWRERHPEWRRNTRARTNYGVLAPTGLTEGWAPTRVPHLAVDQSRLVESRLALASFRSEEDLRDPRQVGRYCGVPSRAALATGAARDVWATIAAERELTAGRVPSQPRPAAFIIRGPDFL
jgi:hypothetical protein